ncbi:MAG: DUF47 family protein, partial [Sulfolobales archaeon]
FRRLFRGSEQELVDSLKKHLSLAKEAIGYSLIMLTEPSKLTMAEILEYRAKIIDLEKKGDKIYDAMISSVLKGAFPLPLIADLGVLLDDFDDILDLIYFLGMELTRGIRVGLTRNPTVMEVYSVSGKMVEKAIESISSLDSALTYITKNIAKATAEASRIDYIEDVVDEIKNIAIEEIYVKSEKLSILEFTHLMEIVRTIDTIVDKVQDASQELVRIFSAVLS